MFSSANKNITHPKGRAFLTSFLTTNTLIQILGYYVILVFLSALLFGGLENFRFNLELSGDGFRTYLRAVWGNLLYLFGEKIEYHTTWSSQSLAQEFFLGSRAFFRTILQTLLLGSLVFKVLGHQRIFRQRKSICVAPTSQKDLSKRAEFQTGGAEQSSGWELRLRFYNASKTIVEGLTITSILRAPKISKSAVWIQNSDIKSGKWSISLPFTPYSFQIPLKRNDIQIKNDALSLVSISGKPFNRPAPVFSPKDKRTDLSGPAFIVLQITGHIAGLGRDFKESIWWDLSKNESIKFGKEVSIDVPAGKRPMMTDGDPENWQGWDKFEDVQEKNYVFGYGSLLNRKSLSRTIEQSDTVKITPARLNGYSRNWNAAKDNMARPQNERLRVKDKNGKMSDFEGAIRFANISKDSDISSVIGGVFSVSLKDLFNLDLREKNYFRVDITSLIEPLLDIDLSGSKVWTYVGTAGAYRRATSIHAGNAVIRDKYFNTVVKGFKDMGEKYLEQFHAEAGEFQKPADYLYQPSKFDK